MLLSDTSRIHDLHTMHISTAGAGVAKHNTQSAPRGSANSSASGSRRGPPPICRKFNDEACYGECRYRHQCALCKETGHPASKCPTKRRK
jgi:hypothetical protein